MQVNKETLCLQVNKENSTMQVNKETLCLQVNKETSAMQLCHARK